MTDQITELINHMFDCVINDLHDPLTDWEESFVESIKDQWDRKHFLSPKQREILERIYDEKTN